MKTWIVFLTLSFLCSISGAVESAERTKIMTEMRGTFGIVPTFMKEFPPEGLPGAWEEFKAIQLSPNTALDGKTKELIGLAVSSQIPCRYCVYFHKKAAIFNRAKDSEIKMAIAVAAMTRKWSTYMTGSQQDVGKFKSEIDKMVAHLKNQKQEMAMEPVKLGDAASAYKDMANNLGHTPEFIKSYPENGIAGAWSEYRDLQMSSKTVLPGKTKDLISLAVSSQIPCDYCVYADTEFAKLNGASMQEIKETIAMAGIVRHWSTFLNGLRQDEKAFEKEVDQIFRHLERNKNLAPKKVSFMEN